MLKEFKADLHIHTCLSPCGDSQMRPRLIVKEAKRKGLDIIGICDHNSAENVVSLKKAGKKEGIAVIGGLEVNSKEEVHVLALFDRDDSLFAMQEVIYENLKGSNDEEAFGKQLILDEEDRVTGSCPRLLIGATELSVEEIVEEIHSFGGLAIASHIDREAFSIISQLGFVPMGLNLDALEISPLCCAEDAKKRFPDALKYPLVAFSDAHFIADIGKSYASFLMEEPSVTEMKKAFDKEDGRLIIAHTGHSPERH